MTEMEKIRKKYIKDMTEAKEKEALEEVRTETARAAKAFRVIVDEFTKAGFTEDQSIAIVLEMLE